MWGGRLTELLCFRNNACRTLWYGTSFRNILFEGQVIISCVGVKYLFELSLDRTYCVQDVIKTLPTRISFILAQSFSLLMLSWKQRNGKSKTVGNNLENKLKNQILMPLIYCNIASIHTSIWSKDIIDKNS